MNLTDELKRIFLRIEEKISALKTQIVLGSGTNTIGKLGANSGVDIGDVDVTSIAAGENHLGSMGGNSANPSASFVRPNDSAQYSVGDIIANSGTAGSVTALTFAAARKEAGSFIVRRARLYKDEENTTEAKFRLHLFVNNPTDSAPSNGDGGVLELNGILAGEYIGYFDFDMTSSPDIQASGIELAATPAKGTDITVKLSSGQDIYGILEARDTYTPTADEVFTINLEVLQD